MNSGMHAHDKGGVMVFLGRSSEQWQRNNSVSSPNTTFIGENDGDRAGHGATGVGDVNNDGFDDLIIGALDNDEGGNNAGQTYLILGSSTFKWNGQYSLSLANASFIGEASGDQSSIWVCKAGDVNKDGFDDFVIGAFEGQSSDMNRKVHLIFGRPTEQWHQDIPLTQANVTFISKGPTGKPGLAWRWVSGAGDLNNDSYSDFIFGDYGKEKTYLILGRPTEEWKTNYYFSESNGSFLGENGFTWFGFSVAGVGDTNMDGHDDLLVSAFEKDFHLGKVYLILGRSSDQWTANMSLNKSYISFTAVKKSDWFGFDISGAGDIDNNGQDDFLIGATGDIFSNNRGKAYLFLSEFTSNPPSTTTETSENTTTTTTTTTKSPDYPQLFILISSIWLIIILRKKRTS
jgi:hypothetical protein